MGCCGCDNRSSANTAGIFALVQCIVGVILAIYNLNIFYGGCLNRGSDAKTFLCFTLYDSIGTVRGLLIFLMILYILWAISSVILLIGNASNKAGYVQQWVVFSTIIIICDVVLPAILMGVTLSKISRQYQDGIYNFKNPYDKSKNNYAASMNLTQNYLVLILTFSRGGLITWICDIALTVYTSRRASEIRNPPRTLVFAPVGVVHGQYPAAVVQGGYLVSGQPPQYMQQGFSPQYLPQSQQYGPNSGMNKPYDQSPSSNLNEYGQPAPPTYASLPR